MTIQPRPGRDRARGNRPHPQPPAVAVIGMACIYPGAHSPEELWQNVLAGRRFFRRAPEQRLPLDDYFDADPRSPGKTYCDQMAVITDWSFDPLEFHIPPITVQSSDITHWLALSTSAAAVRDAGVDLTALDRTRIGVILGNTLAGEFARSHYLRFRWPYVERAIRRAMGSACEPTGLNALLAAVKHHYEAPLPEITEDSLAGNMANTITGRICNHFDLGGGAYIVDGACSSSLLAVASACEHLVNGDMDLVLTGGIDVSLDPFEIIGFAKIQALATDEIRPYDARAGGMLTGEGCGILVLAREGDARALNARIYAVIRGWGTSSDGSGGITAPEVAGQVCALRRAYERAGYPISSVDLIEGHGTGTPLGDRVEIEAILRLLGESPEGGAIRIGSIKGNIGHCKAAAGAAGLIKAVMALDRKVLPPTTNCDRPNPAFGQPPLRLIPSRRGEAWTAGATPRRASVSAMGFGGSNCHITLEEVDRQDNPSRDDLALLGSSQPSELVLLSGDRSEELAARVEALIPIAERICHAELTDLSAALAQAHPSGKFRMAIVATSPRQLAASLRQVSQGMANGESLEVLGDPSHGLWAGSPVPDPELVALFPGQGSQRLNMGMDLLQRYPFVQDLYERIERSVADLLPGGLRSRIVRNLWEGDKPTQERWAGELRDTRVAQPAIVLSSLAMLRVLEYLGLKPSVSLGHSLGEISALSAAGACEAETAVRLAALRGKAMASLDLPESGAMLALRSAPDEVLELIRPFGSALVISNYNSPRQTVISGTSEAIGEMARVCRAKNLPCSRLAVSHAFHSGLVAPAAAEFRQSLEGVSFQPLSGRVISTLTATEVAPDADLRELLSRHVLQPVRFQEAVLEATGKHPALWIEIGPGAVLSGLVGEILGTEQVQCQPTDLEGENSFHLLNCVLARAFVTGLPVLTDQLFSYRFHRPFALDNYAPVLITNPCERPIGLLETSAAADSPPSAVTEGEAAGQKGDDEAHSALSWAINWLAQRTGFPEQAVRVDARLRDDLNLDSIKAAQLVLALSQRLHRRMPAIPTSLANASLEQVVETILLSPSIEESSVQAGAVGPAQDGGLEPWIRTFRIEEIPAPLEVGPELPLPSGGNAIVVADPQCPRALAIASHLRDLGLRPIVADASSLPNQRQMLDDLTVLVLLLPEADRSFLACSPAEFDDRLEGLAMRLFQAFSWPAHGRKGELAGLHCIVLRSAQEVEDVGCDLEAGSAFCKSLQLEYPSARIKWVSLPAGWPPDRWAEVAVNELQRPDDRVSFAYDGRGLRTTRAAVPVAHPAKQPPYLGADDVLLVTGGAKGITSQLAFEIACQTQAKLVLLGSSPMPDPSCASAEDEMLQNIERLEQAGIQHTYIQCDVTDAEAVCRAVATVERELGPVTGILHGAGISELHRFYDMDVEVLLRCVRVKARGLYNLLTAVPPGGLKALHVISSVLGKTGMRSQSDYTLANAWLDGAVQGLSAAYPGLQCLSLGYSIWDEIGMGRRLDWFLEVLLSAGVTPIHIEQGVAAYLDLVQHPQPASTFVITGRLTPELESRLFPHEDKPSGRYLEKVLRWIPGTEIVAETTLSNDTDLYLAEHVFEGTPIFPGVMAAEAMVEAAQACGGNGSLTAVRNLQFQRPLIIPPGGSLAIRTLALTEPAAEGGTSVRVAIRSEADGFKENYCEAECVLGAALPGPANFPPCPELSDPLPLDPDDLAPVPLFQGRFFRRIAAIHALESEKETVTRVRIPESARYFGGADEQCLATGSPAARDAFLQSGAIGLPPRFLPSQIGAMYFYGELMPGSEVICRNRIVTRSDGEYHADLSVYSMRGDLIEAMHDIVLRAPLASALPLAGVASDPVPTVQAVASLRDIFPLPHALEIVEHDGLGDEIDRDAMESETGRMLFDSVSPARKASALGNLVAAKRAACSFSQRYEGRELSPERVSVRHCSDGKPELCFLEGRAPRSFAGVELSLADGAGLSAAWIGPAPAGVDVEAVAERDAETWWGLLGHDGCALALRLATEVGEPFDRAATRVWTILESAKKASLLEGCTPVFDLLVNRPWVLLTGSQDSRMMRFFSSVLACKATSGAGVVLTVAVQMP